mgnify:CR=1 FL=1
MITKSSLFGVLISSKKHIGNTVRLSAVDASLEFNTLSKDKLMLGGFPTSVYENSNGKHVLGVHLIIPGSTFVEYNNLNFASSFNYKGSQLYYKSSGKHNVWVFDIVSGSSEVEHSIPWYGIMLSLNSNREILFHIKSGTPDEEQMASIGGIPMPFVRFEDNWYLAILDDSGS